MVKIYTKKGDDGTTSLYGGKRLSKANAIFELLGGLDELSASLGFLGSCKVLVIKKDVVEIQQRLFEMGASIAGAKPFTITVEELEKKMDWYESKNKPLSTFILPGGTPAACYLHNARTICRRVERAFVAHKNAKLEFPCQYLNRLSDLLFVMARFANKTAKVKEVAWKPKN